MQSDTPMAERARAVIDQHGARPLVAELAARARYQAEKISAWQQAEGRVAWWDRLVFFHDSPDEVRADRLEKAAERTRRSYAAARVRCDDTMAAYAPLEIVYRVECAVIDALADPDIGRRSDPSAAAARVLDAIADRILEHFARGVVVGRVAQRMAHDELRRKAVRRDLGPPARAAASGWAPITEEELAARVATALEDSPELAQARHALAREAHESATATSQLAQAAAHAAHEAELAGLRETVAREEHETAWAEDWVRLAIARAFAVHPVMWVYFTLRGAAAAARAASPIEETKYRLTGAPQQVISGYARAVVLACLLEVRSACSAAFPGVREELWRLHPTIAQPPAHRVPPPPAQGPFRAPYPFPVGAEPLEPVAGLSVALERLGVRSQLQLAVSAATMLAILEQELEQVADQTSWIDRVSFWSTSAPEEQGSALSDRATYYRAVLDGHGRSCLSGVATLAEAHAAIHLGRALVAASQTLASVHADRASNGAVRNRDRTLAALASVRSCLAEHFGVRGERGDWLADIERMLRSANGAIEDVPNRGPLNYEQMIQRLASRIQAHLGGRSSNAGALWAAPTSAEWYASNVFSDACASYPPLLVRRKLDEVERATHDIRGELKITTNRERWTDARGRTRQGRVQSRAECVIHGHDVAQHYMGNLLTYAESVFGDIPCPGEILESWVANQL